SISFFFQAEDGIRDKLVTGVQTCALPISQGSTNRPEIDETLRRMRNHGSLKRSVHTFGFNSRLDDLHAGFLSVKLKHIRKWTDQRRAWAERYTEGLIGTSLKLPKEMPGYRHAYHLYVVEHPKRDHLAQFLVAAGIDAKMH